jgi:hypothetical protein
VKQDQVGCKMGQVLQNLLIKVFGSPLTLVPSHLILGGHSTSLSKCTTRIRRLQSLKANRDLTTRDISHYQTMNSVLFWLVKGARNQAYIASRDEVELGEIDMLLAVRPNLFVLFLE